MGNRVVWSLMQILLKLLEDEKLQSTIIERSWC